MTQRARTETFSPRQCQKILKTTNDNGFLNRKLSDAYVEALSRDMSNRRWKENGDTVRFDRHGNLIDGQHRFHACIKSGVPLKTVAVYDIDDEAIQTIDIGRGRGFAQHLDMKKEKSPHLLGATVRALVAIAAANYTVKATQSELDEVLSVHPNVRDYISPGLQAGIPRSVVSAISYIGNYLGEKKLAHEFARVMKTGEPYFADGDPAHKLRERLIRLNAAKQRLQPRDQLNALVHSWNLFARGHRVQRFMLPDTTVRIDGWNQHAAFGRDEGPLPR